MSLSDAQTGAENFRIDVLAFDGGLSIALAGEFDLTGVARFDEALAAVAEADHAELLIDFTELQFIDSSGVSAIVRAIAHREAAGGPLQATGIRDQVERVLDLVGVLPRLELVPRPQSAVAWPLPDGDH